MMKITHTNKTKLSNERLSSLPIEKCIYCIITLLFLLLFSDHVFAQEKSEAQMSAQTGVLGVIATGHLRSAEQPTLDLITEIKNQAKNQQASTSLLKPYVTREEKIASKESKLLLTPTAKNHFHDFAIYSGSSKLLDDEDGDGYYNTFGVLFDADIVSSNPHQQASVYAEVYLSQNGGPWVHLHTTDAFVLYGDSVEDEYEVISHLTQGYFPDNYNVLIDLYESGYSGIVASYSSADTDLLYSLPLESQDWEYIEIHDEHHGGTLSIFALFSLCILGLIRFYRIQ